MPTPRRALRLLAAGATTVAVAAWAAPASAADDTSISHVEPTSQGVQILVDVPADARVDLSGVSVSIDGEDVESEAVAAGTTDAVRRTTILAVDTSDSMQGARFTAAKTAAEAFLSAAPDDVFVGLVDFNSEVGSALPPTLDREDARSVIGGLDLARGTQLYAGLTTAIAEAGDDGQRSVLVMSDGADTSDTPIDDLLSAIEESGVKVDVVSLDAGGDQEALAQIADAGGGTVYRPTSVQQLTDTFSSEAAVLSRQVLVSAVVPSSADDTAEVSVTLPSSSGDITGTAVAPVRLSGEQAEALPDLAPAEDDGFVAPRMVMYLGIGVFAVGLLVVALLLVPRKKRAMTPAERLSAYTAVTGAGGSIAPPAEPESDPLAGAKQAMSGVLERNEGLERRVAGKLEAAGSELKPSEWLLVHAGVLIGFGVLGLAIGGGNLAVGLIFLLVGGVLPWLYLGFRATRRRKAFDAALPDTLQLVSGSLGAGLSLAQSIDTIVREGREPVSTAFRRVLVETRLGVPLEDALEGVAERFSSKDFAWVVMAIKIQRQIGGNLAELLNTVADTMREREYIRRQVSALAAEGKLSAIVLGSLPPLFTIYLALTNWEYVSVMFTDPRGLLMLVAGVAWLGVGIFWMSRLIKVEV